MKLRPPARIYRNDPVAFIHDNFDWNEGEGPAVYQDEILGELPVRRRVCARGPRGLGKTAIDAWATIWFSLVNDLDGEDWKVPTLASHWRQLKEFLWPEIHKWVRRLRWDRIGRAPFNRRYELLDLSLKLATGRAFAIASDDSETTEGAHANRMLEVYDESKIIPDETWDSTEGAFSAGDAYWLATSTPGEPFGRFYDIQSRKPGFEDWWVRHVTLAECIQAGRISPEWVEQRRLQWGETSQAYQNQVLGDFAAASTDGIIPLSWIEAANERWCAWRDAGFPGVLTTVGADIGGGEEGGDKNVLALAYDMLKVKELRVLTIGDTTIATMEVAGRIMGILDMSRGAKAVIDVIGIGAGVTHRVRERGYKGLAFNAAKGTQLRDKSGELGFADWRSAGWWLLREMLEPGSGFNVCLPPDTDETNLTGDLTAPRWSVNSRGEIVVESKITIRKRIRRSTDYGDAVMQALAGPFLIEEEDRSGGQYQVVYPMERIGNY